MFFVAEICKRALRASIQGYLAVSASMPTSATLPLINILYQEGFNPLYIMKGYNKECFSEIKPGVDKALRKKLCKAGGQLPKSANIGRKPQHEASPCQPEEWEKIMLSKRKEDLHRKGRRERMATRSSLGSFNIGGKISSSVAIVVTNSFKFRLKSNVKGGNALFWPN